MMLSKNNQAIHQFTSIIVKHFMNSTRVGWIIRRTVFNVYVSLNHSWRNERNHFERRDGKPKHQRQFFQNLENFHIKMGFFIESYLQLLFDILYCTQNSRLYYLLETKICFVKKLFSIFLGLCIWPCFFLREQKFQFLISCTFFTNLLVIGTLAL